MVDYREKRVEGFIEWMRWSVVNNDCDPALFMMRYIFDRFELNIEQRYWLAWLYGTTYHLPAAWVIWNEFPDFELVDQGRLAKWNDAHYKKLRYQTDTKYNKGFLPDQFNSYKKWIGGRTQRAAIAQSARGGFDTLKSEVVNNWFKFGRYSSWYYIQTLKQCVGVRGVDPSGLLLNDYSGSRSHRNGLLYVLGEDSLVDQRLSAEKIAQLEKTANDILQNVRALLPPELHDSADFFAMETCLCSYKKLWRFERGRYLGYYLDRQGEEIKQVENDGWDGINWKPLWDARDETIPDKSLLSSTISKDRMRQFLETGTIDRNQPMGLEMLYD